MAKSEMSLDYSKVFENEQEAKINPLRLLTRLYCEHISKVALSAFCYAIKSSPQWVLSIVTANIINIVSYPDRHSIREFWINLVVIIVVILQNIPMHTLHVSYISKAVRHVEAGLRSTLVRKMQQLSLSYHGDMSAGRLQSKVLRDVEAIDFLSRQMMTSLIPPGISLLIVIGLTLYHSCIVALFFVLMAPMAIMLVRFFRSKMSKQNHEVRKKIEEMSGKVSETVEMIPVTRAHGLEDVEIRKVDAALQKIRERGYRLGYSRGLLRINELGCVSAVPSWMSILHSILILFGIYGNWRYCHVSELFCHDNQLGQLDIERVSESRKRVRIFTFRDGSHHVRGDGGIQRPPETRALCFEGVGFRYTGSGRHVLQDFSLSVKPGETVAFVGESGSEKSTILNLIIGFYKPQVGRIWIDGIPMNELSMKRYRRSLAIVLQNNILFLGTIKENITYGLPHISEEKLQRAIWMANLQEVIDSLPDGLETSVGEHRGRLSVVNVSGLRLLGRLSEIRKSSSLMKLPPRWIMYQSATSSKRWSS